MPSCPNCNNSVDSMYCSSCGQKYIVKHTIRNTTDQTLDSLDFRRGVFKTLYYIFFRPGLLISDFLRGSTRTYTHPIVLLFIVIGFFAALNELELTQYKLAENQFVKVLEIAVPMIVAGLFSGSISLFRFNRMEMVFVNVYFACGVLIFYGIFNLVQIDTWINPNLERVKFYWLLILVFTYYIYYFGTIFKFEITQLLVNFVSMILIYFVVSVILSFFIPSPMDGKDVEPALENFYGGSIFTTEIPRWTGRIVVNNSDYFEKIKVRQDFAPLISDFTGDEIRDVALLATHLESNTSMILIFYYIKKEYQWLFLDKQISCLQGISKIDSWRIKESLKEPSTVEILFDGAQSYEVSSDGHFLVVDNIRCP